MPYFELVIQRNSVTTKFHFENFKHVGLTEQAERAWQRPMAELYAIDSYVSFKTQWNYRGQNGAILIDSQAVIKTKEMS